MKKPARLSLLGPRVTSAAPRISARPKTTDPYYLSDQHRAWRLAVCSAAGWRCQAFENGERCAKSSASGDRMFADHIKERFDGGPDDGPGRCLCGAHHTAKTIRERTRRARE